MAKAYWITWYRSVENPAALAEYAARAGPLIRSLGGRFLARRVAARSYEGGAAERTVILEFDSLAQAVAAYENAEYQAIAALLRGAVEREVRLIEGDD